MWWRKYIQHVLGKRRSGFTLIEFLIYFFILGIVLTAVVGFLLDTLQTRAKVKVATEVEQNLRFSISRILEGIRSAKKFDNGGSTLKDADGVLSLEMDDSGIDPTVFDLDNGVLQVTEGAGSPIPLTSPEVTVTKLWFEKDNAPKGTRAINIQIEMEYKTDSDAAYFNYTSSTSSTGVIRKQR